MFNHTNARLLLRFEGLGRHMCEQPVCIEYTIQGLSLEANSNMEFFLRIWERALHEQKKTICVRRR